MATLSFFEGCCSDRWGGLDAVASANNFALLTSGRFARPGTASVAPLAVILLFSRHRHPKKRLVEWPKEF
jgi:hypothetical protein